ncbi:MAG: hypothetical protein ACPGED_02755, partial [Flavobacteriales bacterium]
INDDSSSCIEDESDSVFTIAQPSPAFLNVNPGNSVDEIRYNLNPWNITWTSFFVDATFVSIDYSTDSGNTWINLTPATENDGSFAWPLSDVLSDNMRVRITEVEGTVSGESEFDFSIQPAITITSPNGDNGIQDWRVCTETTITWTSGGTSSYFRLYYSTNNGNSWVAINTNYYSTGNSHSYDWQTPNTPGPGALIRVEDRFDATLVDVSDAAFAIAPAITITAPNGGETLGAGEQVNITWINDGATNFYDIDYSTDNGSTWNNIAFNQFIATQSYLWTVPGQLSSNYLLRVRDHVDNCKSDESDQVFEVDTEATSSIEITAPNGGENLNGCSTVMITWNSLATSNMFNIEYSLDGGINWSAIANDHFTVSGTYNWTASNEFSNNMVFRVSDSNAPGITDMSDAPISIQGASANAGDDITVCAGENVILQASGGSTYSWTPAGSLDNPNAEAPLASPTVTTTYELTAINAFGCSATDQVTVTVDNGLCEIEGCLDNEAYNYNPNATVNSGFCLYTEGQGNGNDSCTGDLDGDGAIGASDLLVFLSSFGTFCKE